MEKPCPHGRLTNESPCFREEGTFLSANGGQALGWVPAFLDFLDLPGSLPPQGCLSVVWPGLGREGWWLMDQEDQEEISVPDFHEIAYGVSRREILRGLPALWSLILLSLRLWEVSRLYFLESLPAPVCPVLGTGGC